MSIKTSSRNIVLTTLGAFIIAVLLWGVLIAHKPILATSIAALGILLGALVYLVERYFARFWC